VCASPASIWTKGIPAEICRRRDVRAGSGVVHPSWDSWFDPQHVRRYMLPVNAHVEAAGRHDRVDARRRSRVAPSSRTRPLPQLVTEVVPQQYEPARGEAAGMTRPRASETNS